VKRAFGVEALTDRELTILQLTMHGWTSKEIGRHLHLAIGTIKAHRQTIMAKLGASNMTHAVAIFLGGVAA
jgi:DNA-binding NarL/FixJ family response regulator